MEEGGMPPLSLWVGCEEARIVGMVTVGRRATQSVSEDACKDGRVEKKNSHVDELERDDRLLEIFGRKDAVGPLKPLGRPVPEGCVEAECGVPCRPMLDDVPP